MHLGAVLITLFSATFSVAENTVETNDVPNTCLAACQFTIDLSARCDQETDGDSGYRTCVCGAADSQIRLTECATCVKDNGMRDPDDNDVADLMDDCGWDFNSASASCKYLHMIHFTPIVSCSNTFRYFWGKHHIGHFSYLYKPYCHHCSNHFILRLGCGYYCSNYHSDCL